MEGDASSLGREYDSLDKRARTLRDRVWGLTPSSAKESSKQPKRPGIVERLRGERELGILDKRMEDLRTKIQGLIEVGL